jgi:hypothetical protein
MMADRLLLEERTQTLPGRPSRSVKLPARLPRGGAGERGRGQVILAWTKGAEMCC